MSQQQQKMNKNLERAAHENQEFVIQPAVQPIEKHESNNNGFYNEQHVLQILSTDYEYMNAGETTVRSKEIKHLTIQGLQAFKARNEIESMLAAQMLVTHNASMQCYSRLQMRYFDETALINSDLNNASKLSRTFVTLLEALHRCHQE